MRRTRFDAADCPLARTTDLLGDWWTPLVLRELMFGRTRFAEIEEALDVSKGVLAQRLKRFETDGLVERRRYQDKPARHEYVLTEKGRALWDVVVVMWQFGDTWLFDDEGSDRVLIDLRTGDPVEPIVVDARTGEWLDLASTEIQTRSYPETAAETSTSMVAPPQPLS